MHRLVAESLRVTHVLLVAALLLIAAGSLGLGGDLSLAGLLAVFGLAGLALRARLGAVGRVRGRPMGWYLRALPLGPLVAALLIAVYPGTTPDELEAVGGMVGLVAMLNYFLRPLYRLAIHGGRRVASRLGS